MHGHDQKQQRSLGGGERRGGGGGTTAAPRPPLAGGDSCKMRGEVEGCKPRSACTTSFFSFTALILVSVTVRLGQLAERQP